MNPWNVKQYSFMEEERGCGQGSTFLAPVQPGCANSRGIYVFPGEHGRCLRSYMVCDIFKTPTYKKHYLWHLLQIEWLDMFSRHTFKDVSQYFNQPAGQRRSHSLRVVSRPGSLAHFVYL